MAFSKHTTSQEILLPELERLISNHANSTMDGFKQLIEMFQTHRDVYDVINIHLAVLKLFGELFVCRDRRTGLLYVARRSFATFVVQLIALIILVIGGNLAQIFLSEKDDTYLHYGSSFLITVSGTCAITVSISNAINGKKVWAILRCFESFDSRLEIQRAPVNQQYQKRQILRGSIVGSFLVVVCTGTFVMALLSTYANRILRIATVVQIIIFVIVLISSLCQLMIVTYLANQRLRHLRRFFELNFLPWKSALLILNEITMVKQHHPSSNFTLFHDILDMLDDLLSAVRLINKAYFVQLILMASSNVPAPTLALFATYRSFVTSNYDLQNLIIAMSLSSIIYLLSFFYLIYLSVGIKHEIEHLTKAFHLLINIHEVKFEKYVQSSSMFLLSKRMALHLGPMELNWKLAFLIIGTIVSYLVILIQFYAGGV